MLIVEEKGNEDFPVLFLFALIVLLNEQPIGRGFASAGKRERPYVGERCQFVGGQFRQYTLSLSAFLFDAPILSHPSCPAVKQNKHIKLSPRFYFEKPIIFEGEVK
jgi:hypothetical protein